MVSGQAAAAQPVTLVEEESSSVSEVEVGVEVTAEATRTVGVEAEGDQEEVEGGDQEEEAIQGSPRKVQQRIVTKVGNLVRLSKALVKAAHRKDSVFRKDLSLMQANNSEHLKMTRLKPLQALVSDQIEIRLQLLLALVLGQIAMPHHQHHQGLDLGRPHHLHRRAMLWLDRTTPVLALDSTRANLKT